MGLAERVYVWCLRRVLPRSFVIEAETEMVEVFRDGLAAKRGIARIGFAVVACVDLLLTAWRERGAAALTGSSVGSGVGERARRLSGLALDVRTTVRDLGRRPGAALFQSVTLGIGIAATLLILVLVRDVLMKPLPFRDADRLVRLQEQSDEGGVFWPSRSNIEDWREHATAVEDVAAASVGTVTAVLAGGVALRQPIGEVSRGFFGTLGVEPVHGRLFTEAENSPGGPPVALIDEGMWRGVLGGRPLDDLTVTIDSEVYRVIGVMPGDFRFLGNGNAWLGAAVWLPLERMPPDGGRQSHGYITVARLKQDFDLARASSSLDALAARLKLDHGEPTHADRIVVQELGSAVYGAARFPLRIMLAASIVVLLVACLNLAAALLARGLMRDRELAVRSAIGARRSDLMRYQLTQALVLAVPGALLGAGGAWAALSAIRRLAPTAVPRLDEATLDVSAVAIALALAVGAAAAAGVIPALVSSPANVAKRMRTRGASSSRGRQRLWNGFVAAQAALTLVLLVSSSMLARSLMAALAVDIGYDPRDVTLVSVSLPESTYADPDRRIVFHDRLLDRLREDAAVNAVGLTNIPPDEVHVDRSGSSQ